MQDYVYFDLETQRTISDVGGTKFKGDLKMSVGVTYSTKDNKYVVYGEDRVHDLIEQLLSADCVIGYNHISFDYEVLMGYDWRDLQTSIPSLDMLVDIEQKLGHRLPLDSIAKASLGAGKSADGLQAIRWWREGKLMEIAEYCCFDVKVTKMVHEFGAKHGYVKYEDRFNRIQAVDVDWKTA